MAVTRRKQKKSGRKTRKNEFLPFFKTLYAPQGGGSNTTTWGNSYAISSVAGTLAFAANTNKCGTYTVPGSTPATTAGYPEVGRDGPSGTGSFHSPRNIYSDSQGNIIVQDAFVTSMPVRLRMMTPQGVLTSYLDGRYGYKDSTTSDPNTTGNGNASTNTVRNFAVDRNTDVIYFMESANATLRVLLRTNGKTLSGRNAPTGIAAGVSSIIGSPTSTTTGRIDGAKNVATFNPGMIMTIDSINRRMYIMEFATAVIRMVDITDPNSYYVSSLFNLNKGYVGIQSAICDRNGNLYYTVYYSDNTNGMNTYSHCIYKLVPPAAGVKSTSGTLNSTCLLNATPLPAGSAIPVVFAGSDTAAGYRDSATGTTALFNRPIGLACDTNNNIYVADSANNLIRMISPSGAVTTVAGTFQSSNDLTNAVSYGDGENIVAQFSQPVGITVDPSNTIYVCDNGNAPTCAPFSRIRKLTLIPKPSAPTNVALLSKDSISVTFSWSGATTGFEPIYSPKFYAMMQVSGNASGPVSGGAPARYDMFPFPDTANILTIPNRWIQNNKVIASQQQGYYQNNMISIPVNPGTTYSNIQLVAYNGTGSTASTALTTPVSISPAANNYTLLKSGKVGAAGYVNSITTMSQFNLPMGITYNANTTLIYVADSANNCIRTVDPLGNTNTFFGTGPNPGNTLTSLNKPTEVRFGSTGDFPLFVVDSGNNRVLSITAAGVATLVNTSGVALTGPRSLAIDTTNILYVTSTSQSCIYAINNGVTSVYAGTPGTTGSTDGPRATSLFNAPAGISYDPFMKYMYLADSGNHLIRIVNTRQNIISTLAGLAGTSGMANGQGSVVRFNTPTEVITEAVTGNLYIVDSKNNVIRKATPAGLTSTYSGGHTGITATPAGTRTPIPYADGTSTPTAFNTITTNVAYNTPYSICLMGDGMMFVSDTGNSCIRAISPYPPPTPPTRIYLADVTTTSATIAWSGDANATAYAYSITPTGGTTVLPTATGSPATFTGLSPTTKYFLNLILRNNAGSISATPVPCVTGAVANSLVLTVTNPVTTYGVNGVIATATLNWTGFRGADTLSCSITPKRNGTAGTEVVNLPANQPSPYILTGLIAATQYSVTLTAQFTSIPTSSGSTSTTANVVQTSQPVVFTSLTSLKATLKTVIGYSSNHDDTTVPTTPVPLMRTPTGTPATPAAPSLIQYIMKMPGAVALDSAGNLYTTSVTAIIKLTPSPASNKSYMFDTRLANPVPTLVQPNTIGVGSTAVLYAGVPSGRIATPLNSTWTYSGANIRFYAIGGLAYDSRANILYATDTVYHFLYKITYSGTTPTCEILIGSPTGLSGSTNGPRGTGLLNAPKGLCVGPDGAVYIAEFGNNAVRKYFNGTLTTISTSDKITTTNQGVLISSSLSGVAIAPDGAIFATCVSSHCIYKLTPSESAPGTFVTSLFAGAVGISGNTATDGTSLTTVRFNMPAAICIDSNYNIFISDTGNFAVRQIIPSTSTTLTIIGRGTGFVDGNSDVAKIQLSGFEQATFAGLTCDNFGNIYVGDQWNDAVRMVSIYPVTITSEQLTNYQSSAAIQVAARQASSAVAQQASSALRQGASSALIQQASSAVRQQASSAIEQRASSALQQKASQALASSALEQAALSGPVNIKNEIVSRIKSIQADIMAKSPIVYSATADKAAKQAAQAAITSQTAILSLALTELADASIPIFSIAPMHQDGNLQTVIPDPYLESVGLRKLYDAMRKAYIVVDQSGYIVNNIEVPSERPLVFGQRGGNTGEVSTFAGNVTAGNLDGIGTAASFNYPNGIVIDSNNNIYIADQNNASIRKITPSGVVTTVAGGSGTGLVNGPGATAKFNGPSGITVDSNGNLYVVDRRNHCIRKIDTAGNVTTFAGSSMGYLDGLGTTAKFNSPFEIVIDSAQNLYVSDFGNNCIRKITPDGNVTTFAGSPSRGYPVPADGTGSAATFYAPLGLEIDSAGNLYVVDHGNYYIRKITPDRVVTTIFLVPGNIMIPRGIAVNKSGTIYVMGSGSTTFTIYTISNGTLVPFTGASLGYLDGPINTALFKCPEDIAFDSVGNMFITDAANNCIRKLSNTAQLQASSAVAQAASSAVKQEASAALPGLIASSARQQAASSATQQQASSALRLAASSAVQQGASAALASAARAFSVAERLASDIPLPGDYTLPSTISPPWFSFFDRIDRRYFYINRDTGVQQYEHPNPPILNKNDPVIIDATTKFLPPGWVKYQCSTPNAPYYFNSKSLELSWIHPNPPPNPSNLRAVPDATLLSTYSKYIDPTTNEPFYINAITQEGQWNYPDLAFNPGPSAAARASSAVQQSASSALIQRASSATRQAASSAVQQTASSAIQQAASSALQQSASSALIQRASSATRQAASSAVQQTASAATRQAASSALQQSASSALIQTASSATRQAASSAVQQTASAATRQAASSALQQSASSALQQSASSAIQQTASSAVQQTASSATRQAASSAVRQGASSALQQQASSAVLQAFTASAAILGPIALKDTIKSDVKTLRNQLNAMASQMASGSSSKEEIASILTQLSAKQTQLTALGIEIIQLNPNFMDPELQTIIPAPELEGTGTRKVFDSLRNAYIFLDSANNIVQNPITPYMRPYTQPVRVGGATKTRKTKR